MHAFCEFFFSFSYEIFMQLASNCQKTIQLGSKVSLYRALILLGLALYFLSASVTLSWIYN